METPVNILALLERIEIRLQGRKKMPADEAVQLTVLKHYFMDQLAGTGRMKKDSIDAAFYNFDKEVYMSRVSEDGPIYMNILSVWHLLAGVAAH
jgi:hypothetical protein